MNHKLLALLVAASFTTSAVAIASDDNWKKDDTMTKSSTNKWQDGAKDAWIDGKAEATLLFNGNLDSFDINTDVKNSVVTLTGKVDNEVDRELAEELIMGIDGVKEVNNELTVYNNSNENDSTNNDEDSTMIVDAKISTVIKSRLLFDSEVSGTDINVDVDNMVVTLEGTVYSESEKQLALAIAKNAEDVESVVDMLKIVPKKAR